MRGIEWRRGATLLLCGAGGSGDCPAVPEPSKRNGCTLLKLVMQAAFLLLFPARHLLSDSLSRTFLATTVPIS